MALFGIGSNNATASQLQGGLPSTGGTLTSPTLTTGVTNMGTTSPQWYPASQYPVQTPQPTTYLYHAPVIREDHSEPLHFMDKSGHIHSFDVKEVFTRLGLLW
jgi:hypothetical protein